RQENREPRALHEDVAAALQAGRETGRVNPAALLPSPARLGPARYEENKIVPEVGRVAAKALPEILFQTESHRRIRSLGRRAIPGADPVAGGDEQASAREWRPFTPRNQIPRPGERALALT